MWYYYVFGFVAALPLIRQYCNGPMCGIKRDLSNKVALITGANTGIGKETARALAEMGATVVLACRSPARAKDILDELRAKYGDERIVFLELDLANLESVRAATKAFNARFSRLDLLINNAGVMALPNRETTPQGFEMQFGTNHIGHFALTLALAPLIEKTPESRVVTVSSMAHLPMAIMSGTGQIFWDDINLERTKYRPFVAYSQSKLANILFARQLQKELDVRAQKASGAAGSRIKSVVLHPGAVKTDLQRHTAWMRMGFMDLLFFKDALHGAQTTLQCVLEDFETLVPGGYYSDCKLQKTSAAASDPDNAQRLWKVSLELVRQKGFSDLVASF